jgi:transcriptional regulator with XRE-family HTH domain
MISTSELLTAAKAANGIPSNYRLARVLGTSDNTLHRWHSGRNTPDDANAVRLAELAGLDVDYVVASMRAQRETDERLKGVWQSIADRLRAGPIGVGAAVAIALASPSSEAFSTYQAPTVEQGSLCVM